MPSGIQFDKVSCRVGLGFEEAKLGSASPLPVTLPSERALDPKRLLEEALYLLIASSYPRRYALAIFWLYF